jgi:broad specificity phosphatase PhoE
MSDTGLPGLPGTLVLLRHPQSVRNANKHGTLFFPDDASRDAVKGVGDHLTPLTEFGHRQAIEAGAALKARFGVPDEIFHSGYVRTEAGKDGILAAYTEAERAKIRIERDWRIRERSTGWCFDMTVADVAKHFPWLQEYWRTAGEFFGMPPGGESLAQVVDRVAPFVKDLYWGRAGRTTFVVSHGNTIRCLRFLIEDLTYAAFDAKPPDVFRWPPNCGMVAYRFDADGKPELIAENEQLWTE